MKWGIIGGGAWGTAFASILSRNHHEVLIWDRSAKVVADINESHQNSRCFPDVPLPKNISATSDATLLSICEIIVIALPFQAIREFLTTSNLSALKNKKFLLLSKGIEIDTDMLGHQIFQEHFPEGVFGVVSGPNFASEIVANLPAATMVASYDTEFMQLIKGALTSPTLKVYTTDDVIGVEVCGALKNVIAIASGICMGAALGDNARAALIARSLNELGQVVKVLGGKAETVVSVAGIGDLLLTCTSMTSRNFTLGFAIGERGHFDSKLQVGTVEGVFTAQAMVELARKHNLVLPIIQEAYNILYQGKGVQAALKSLMERRDKEYDLIQR